MSYKESEDRKRKLNKLLYETEHSYGSGAWYNERKGRIIKYSASDNSHYASYLKKRGARLYRRKYKKSDVLLQRSDYKKTFDYKWMIY